MSTAVLSRRNYIDESAGRFKHNHLDSYEKRDRNFSSLTLKELENRIFKPHSEVVNVDFRNEISAVLLEDAEYSHASEKIKADLPLSSDVTDKSPYSIGIYGKIAAFRSLRTSMMYA